MFAIIRRFDRISGGGQLFLEWGFNDVRGGSSQSNRDLDQRIRVIWMWSDCITFASVDTAAVALS